MPQPLRILVPVSAGFEEIEAVTVVDVLRRAGAEVVVGGVPDAQPIRGSNGILLTPDAALSGILDAPWDLVAIPGGLQNTATLSTHEPLLALLRQRFGAGEWVAAICAAPRVLGAAGIAGQIALTSHPVTQQDLQAVAKEYREETVVEDHRVVTSRGAGTALAWALALVERLFDAAKRESVEIGLALLPLPPP